MIDLHCHLLHGIDDGPGTLRESLELCRIAVADGITHAIVTPHIHPGRWKNTRSSIGPNFESLKSTLVDKNILLKLGYAGEVRLSDNIIQQVAEDEIPFYGEVDGYRIMLLEFPHGHVIPGSEKLVEWLLSRRIRPMIAHPERNRQVMRDVGRLQPFITGGCWIQVTAGSVTGAFGEKARAAVHELLDAGAVTAVASDGHNAKTRQPALSQAFGQIAARYGQEHARRLMLDTPAKIVAGQFAAQAIY